MALPTFTTQRLDFRPDDVVVLTFDQPGSKANVLTDEVWADFESALDHLAGQTDVKGLVLASSKPGIFIAGADLKLLGDAKGPNDPAVRAFIDRGNRTLFKLEALPFPTCAAVDGAALGGGCEVALACDLRICGHAAKFGLPEVNLGLIPGWGATQRLPRSMLGLTPLATAFGIISGGRTLTCLESIDAGFIHEVGDSTGLVDRACHMITVNPHLEKSCRTYRDLKLNPIPRERQSGWDSSAPSTSSAVQAAASVMTLGAALPLHNAIAIETEAFMQLAGSAESKRLIAAFFAARKK